METEIEILLKTLRGIKDTAGKELVRAVAKRDYSCAARQDSFIEGIEAAIVQVENYKARLT